MKAREGSRSAHDGRRFMAVTLVAIFEGQEDKIT